MFHTIFQQPDADSVWAQAREVVEFCQQKFADVEDYLEELLDELLAFTSAPKAVLRLPSFSGHPICTDLVSVREDVHCESTAQEVHAGVPA